MRSEGLTARVTMFFANNSITKYRITMIFQNSKKYEERI